MSHSVRVKQTQWKDINLVKKAFEDLGWTIVENATHRTYPYDPALDTVYKYVAINPAKDGYDVGLIIEKDGTISAESDFGYGGLAASLGNNYGLVTQAYNKHLVRQVAQAHHKVFTSKVLPNRYLEVTVEV